MSGDNEGLGLLRKMARTLGFPSRAAPTSSMPPLLDGAGDEADPSELRAMVERKHRNDFVRRRELDMLRRVRRLGLTPQQAAALGNAPADSADARPSQPPMVADGVKAKIDAIEQQMGNAPAPRAAGRPGQAAVPPLMTAVVPPVPTLDPAPAPASRFDAAATQPMHFEAPPAAPAAAPAAVHAAVVTTDVPAVRDVAADAVPTFTGSTLQDRDLDDAVIAYANADFAHCERSLLALVADGGLRARDTTTWLVLLDLYRATGQQAPFETQALAYAQQFQASPPQWLSLPQLVSDATRSSIEKARGEIELGWICPDRLDLDAVHRLRAQLLQSPQPWVMDWTPLAHVDASAAAELQKLMREWADAPVEMRWIAGSRLFAVLQDIAPTGVRDVDPSYWLLRLEALRLVNRPDQFDEAAIDYCVTYEVSPPSWERAQGHARLAGSGLYTRSAALSVVGEAVSSFLESGLSALDAAPVAVTTLDLSGQLAGDINPLLAQLDSQLGPATIVRISCALLIRVDFIAAGDLLNWVIAKHHAGLQIAFLDTHRLIALMFGAMGITEHARVQLRNG